MENEKQNNISQNSKSELKLNSEFEKKVLEKLSQRKKRRSNVFMKIDKNILMIVIAILIMINVIGAVYLVKNYEVEQSNSSKIIFDELSE